MLDGDPASPKGAQPPNFQLMSVVARWIKMPRGREVDRDPRLTQCGMGRGPVHTVLDGDPAPPVRGTADPGSFRPMCIVTKRSPISATVEHMFPFLLTFGSLDASVLNL